MARGNNLPEDLVHVGHFPFPAVTLPMYYKASSPGSRQFPFTKGLVHTWKTTWTGEALTFIQHAEKNPNSRGNLPTSNPTMSIVHPYLIHGLESDYEDLALGKGKLTSLKLCRE